MKRIHLVVFALSFLYFTNVRIDRIRDSSRGILWSDGEGYYDYLPGLFILKDFHKLQPGSMWPYYNKHGEFVDKYTCGVSYFELPFFYIGYWISAQKGLDTHDYLSTVYSKAIAFGGFLFSFLGLLLLYKILIGEYKETVVFWTLLSVYLGTNLFHYSTKVMGGSHTYSFFLFALLIYFIPVYFKNPRMINSLFIGIILGWIVLIRPTNAIVFLLFFLHDIYSFEALKDRCRFFITRKLSLLFIMLSGFAMIIPQLLYWKEMTDHWIYYSYTEEGFKYWNNPKIAAVLFDVQNGLFIYSPLVVVMIVGVFYGLKNRKFQSPAILLVFCLATYIFASWWAWWFGGAFGHRSYVEYYAILTIPLAGLIDKIFSSPKK